MNSKAYPGRGLSPSQLIFALNEELKRTAYSPSCVGALWIRLRGPVEDYVDLPYRFTWDEVLELNRGTSAVLATIREWMNSFVPINRVPLDILSLIPTHLSSQRDRFRVTFVCRRWRRTFLQCAGLWSHLCLSKGEVYLKTLLARAKGSPLTILANGMDLADTIPLLPPYAEQIAGFDFEDNRWTDIQRFSEINCGPLPLLRTLNINAIQGTGPDVPLFNSSVGLKELRLHSKTSLFLSHFFFPNLTLLELSVVSVEGFLGLQLLDFLEASPMLRAVRMKIIAPISLDGISQERVVILHNAESLRLLARDGGPGYKLATHISCPSAKHTSLTHIREKPPHPPQEPFPASASLYAIIRQYARNPVEEVTLKMKTKPDYFIAYSLTFLSPDATIIKLRFKVCEQDPDGLVWTKEVFGSMSCFAFHKASKTIRDLPLLANVKRLHIHGLLDLEKRWIVNIAKNFRELLLSLGPLDELALCRCDVQLYFFPFLCYPKALGSEELVPYPLIRVLTISDPLDTPGEEVVAYLVEIAKTRYELGEPFERVAVCMYDPAKIEERLKLWVGAVDCCVPDVEY